MNEPINTLYTHIEVGSLSIAECYPQIREENTNQDGNEVQRIIFRSLIPSRLMEDEVFTFKIANLVSNNVNEVKTWCKDTVFVPNSIYFVYIGKYKTLKAPIKTAFTKRGFIACDIINRVFDVKIAAASNSNEEEFLLAFQDPENKTAVVIGSVQNNYIWNAVASVSSLVMPWYFGEGHELTPEERALVVAVDEGTEEFIEKATVLYEKSCVPNRVAEIKFRNMYKTVKDNLIRRYSDNITSWNCEFLRLKEQIEKTVNQIRETTLLKESLESASTENDGKDLVDFFATRPTVAIKEWIGNDLVFTGMAYLTPFSNAAKAVSNILHSIYYCLPNDITQSEAKCLMNAVFVDDVIRIPVYVNYRFSMERSSIDVLPRKEPAPKFSFCIPQPHHEYYQCTGTNLSRASEFLRNGKYAEAINQALGSISTLNMGDDAVTSKFAQKELWKADRTPYMLPDKTKVNYIDAIKWLKENAETTETEE